METDNLKWLRINQILVAYMPFNVEFHACYSIVNRI